MFGSKVVTDPVKESPSVNTMAPGSSSLLRARRRDATLKPNRVLDKSSSRGMIYENEELRLRTININAEVERSQSDIKKLRRENELLRREIWSLRDECDRLEELLKRKQQEEEEEQQQQEEEDEEDEEDEEESSDDEDKEEKRKAAARDRRGLLSSVGDTLSVVQEETEEPSTSREPTPTMNDNDERQCEEYVGVVPPLVRVHSVHPYTAAATVDFLQLPALTVGEVIESCWKSTGTKLDGVRLLGTSLYLSFRDQSSLEKQISLGITLRGIKLDLEDVSQGTLVLAMSGVPHTLQDPSLAKVLSQFGPVIGYIERRFYRSVDTGERLARIRLLSSLPKRIYVEGHEIAVRSLAHDELAKLAALPNRIVRSALQVRETGGDGGSSPSVIRRGGDSETSGSTRRSRQRSRRGHSPSSSSEQDSPNKPPRRKMSIRRRDPAEDGIMLERERSNSLSSRCSDRRKLSFTGRESGKLPWFACWGNGCI